MPIDRSVKVDPTKVREFVDGPSFNKWLGKNHDVETELWIKIHKVHTKRPSITPVQAIDVCLCWGWIDAIRKAFDEDSYLQRYTRRGPKSIWSLINVNNVKRLVEDGRMTKFGLAHVEAARADGRWDRAYASGKAMKIPEDLQKAIDASPTAKKMLATLTEQNRFALAFRMHQVKTPAGRAKKAAAFVEMLEKGETAYPQAKVVRGRK